MRRKARGRTILLALAVLLLLTPTALAAQEVEGQLTTIGTVRIGSLDTLDTSDARAIYATTSASTILTLDAAQSFVCYEWSHYATTTLAGHTIQTQTPDQHEDCANATEVHVDTLEGQSTGYAGFSAGKAAVTVLGPESATTRSLPAETFASPDADRDQGPDRNDPRDPAYAVNIATPHLRVDAGGDATITGEINLKIRGLTLRVTTASNTTTFTTGRTQTPGPISDTNESWVVIRAPMARASLSNAAILSLALGSFDASARGPIAFEATMGSLATSAGTLLPTPGHEDLLRGDLALNVAPSGSNEATLNVHGSVAETSMALQGGHVSTPARFFAHTPWPFILLGLVVSLGGVGGTLLVRAKLRVPQASASTQTEPHPLEREAAQALVDQAELEGDEGHHENAADLLLRARQRANLPGLALREGIHRLTARQYPKALAALDVAMQTDSGGEAEWMATAAALEWGADDLAETYLIRGLERATNPEWLGNLVDELSGQFEPLTASDAVRTAADLAANRAPSLQAAPSAPPGLSRLLAMGFLARLLRFLLRS